MFGGIINLCKLQKFKKKWRAINYSNDTYPKNIFGIENVDVGDYSYGAISINTSAKNPRLHIGKFCSIAKDVLFVIANEHPMNYFSTFPFKTRVLNKKNTDAKGKREGSGIYIADDVWIGVQAIVLDGVTVGQGAVIGAGAVVTKDVPPYAIAAGNPARVIRYRFDEKFIESLLSVDFDCVDKSYIEEHLNDLYQTIDEQSFILNDKLIKYES